MQPACALPASQRTLPTGGWPIDWRSQRGEATMAYIGMRQRPLLAECRVRAGSGRQTGQARAKRWRRARRVTSTASTTILFPTKLISWIALPMAYNHHQHPYYRLQQFTSRNIYFKKKLQLCQPLLTHGYMTDWYQNSYVLASPLHIVRIMRLNKLRPMLAYPVYMPRYTRTG